MKATDLMIGDWVLYRPGWIDDDTETPVYESENGFPVRLTCIYNDLAQYDDILPDGTINTIEVADFELFPIPITPEILGKNGFHYGNTASEEDFCNAVGCSYPEEGWCYDEGAGEIKILFPTGSDGGLIRLDDQSADRHLELVFVEPIMLHELQHALKLCGIDKEITL